MPRSRVIRCRPFSTRILAVLLLLLAFGAYCYYITATSGFSFKKQALKSLPDDVDPKRTNKRNEDAYREKLLLDKDPPEEETCPVLDSSEADIDTVDIFPTFDFQPSWMRSKEFWDKSFEERYEKIRNDTQRFPLKVIVVPHSHNDPGWLQTFEHYFEWKSKNILNNMVSKLQQLPNMTFIWTEISFLSAWWDRAHPVKQKALKKLIREGRVEITTGGWVMPDEACTHVYALVDQFIEGHNWVKSHLGVNPKNGWSIDPFGHGPTVPYLLDQSGLEGTVIQRIHYAWKQWLAKKQIEEFYWMGGWESSKPRLVVHNLPFDIYSIKSTCGPHPAICLGFDFRKIPGEYTEYSAKHEDITEHNLHAKAKTLLEEYERIGSLTPHNVALVPLGDDFRYEHAIEFDAQYYNYQRMFHYINSHPQLFNADVRFGTPRDYFAAVKERSSNIPTLKGDFFVYSDIFMEGKPAYWSGYFTTRPYLKILARQFEHQLRTSEILFTFVFNHIKQSNDNRLISAEKRLEKLYEQLITARRNLGLFQHHDAITGTSKANVMYDYGTKLLTSMYHCMRLQEVALSAVMLPDASLHQRSILQSEVEWETYGKPAKKLQISLVDKNKVIVFNPLMEPRTEVITLKSNTTKVRVFDTLRNEVVQYQLSPVLEVAKGERRISTTTFDLSFVATLPALTAVTFQLQSHTNISHNSLIFCNTCHTLHKESPALFVGKRIQAGDIQLENSLLKLLVNSETGFLRQIYRKDLMKRSMVELQFGAYQSAQRHSGAYLFMPDYDSPEKPVLEPYSRWDPQDDNVFILSGPVSTEVTVMYLPFLLHTLRIYNAPELAHAVFIENIVDFESPPKNRETELFMRVQTDIQNGEPPEFYTDQNGFQYQKRVKVEKLGIEANYYPATTMVWLQDNDSRVSLVTGHAQGAAAFEPGRLELMLDRRTLYDDFRGVGEGVVDNKPTTFHSWLLLEPTPDVSAAYPLPSRRADRLSRALNYPPNVYLVDSSEHRSLIVSSSHRFASDLPPGLHLLTLRTITDAELEQFPSTSCYMVLQRPGAACSEPQGPQHTAFPRNASLHLRVRNITAVSLTGLHTHNQLDNFQDINLQPMEVKTFKIHF